MPLAALRPSLEAVLMVADQPLDTVTLASAVGYPVEEVTAALVALAAEYTEQGRGFELRNVAAGGATTRARSTPWWSRASCSTASGRGSPRRRWRPSPWSPTSSLSPGPGVGHPRRQRRRRDADPARPRARRGGRSGPRDRGKLYRTTNYFLERIGVTSIDELPELAPYLPDMDDMEDELAEVAQVAAPSPVEHPKPAAIRSRGDRDRRRRTHPAPEAARDVGRRLPPQVRGADARGPGRRGRRGRDPVGDQGEPDHRRDPGGRQAVAPVSPHVYLVLNKPRGVVSTMSDPEGRSTLLDLVADRPERLFHVGRLDTDTSGLLLLTNDGVIAQRMAHPSYEVDKTYVAEVDGEAAGRRCRSCSPASRWRTARSASRRYASSAARTARTHPARRSWSWSSMRGATGSCGACSTTSAIPCAD